MDIKLFDFSMETISADKDSVFLLNFFNEYLKKSMTNVLFELFNKRFDVDLKKLSYIKTTDNFEEFSIKKICLVKTKEKEKIIIGLDDELVYLLVELLFGGAANNSNFVNMGNKRGLLIEEKIIKFFLFKTFNKTKELFLYNHVNKNFNFFDVVDVFSESSLLDSVGNIFSNYGKCLEVVFVLNINGKNYDVVFLFSQDFIKNLNSFISNIFMVDEQEGNKNIIENLNEMLLECQVVFGEVEIELNELMKIQVGDCIIYKDKLEIWIEDCKLFNYCVYDDKILIK